MKTIRIYLKGEVLQDKRALLVSLGGKVLMMRARLGFLDSNGYDEVPATVVEFTGEEKERKAAITVLLEGSEERGVFWIEDHAEEVTE